MVRRWRSPLDAAPAASLAPNDLVALLERAFSFAILALLFLLGGVLLHGVILCGAMDWERRAERAAGIRARFAG